MQKITIKYLLQIQEVDFFLSLKEGYFTKTNKKIFSLIKSYYNKFNNLPNYNMVYDKIENSELRDRDILLSYLKSLNKIDSFPTEKEMLDSLKEDFIVRNIDKDVEEIVNIAEKKDIETLKLKLNETLQILNSNENFIPKNIKEAEYQHLSLAKCDVFLPTLHQHNADLYGLSLIGADSGFGKSIFAINQAIYTYNQGYNVCFLSLELPIPLLLVRMYCHTTQTKFKDFISQDKDTQAKIIDEWKKFYFNKNNEFYIQHKRYTNDELLNVIDMFIKKNVKLFVIDYLNLIEFKNYRKDEWRNLADLVKQLHDIAVSNGIIILSPTQIDVEEKTDKSLTIRTRGTKELLYSASTMYLLYANDEEKEKNLARVGVYKSRNSRKLTCYTETQFDTFTFKDLNISL